MITRSPIVPGEEEMKLNTRARSSKLRVFEKVKLTLILKIKCIIILEVFMREGNIQI